MGVSERISGLGQAIGQMTTNITNVIADTKRKKERAGDFYQFYVRAAADEFEQAGIPKDKAMMEAIKVVGRHPTGEDLRDPEMYMNKIQTYINPKLERRLKRVKEQEMGNAIQSVTQGDYAGVKAQEGRDISNIQEGVENVIPGSVRGKYQAGTQEEATQMLAQRMPGRAISQQQMEQYPAYRSLPRQADIDRQKQQEMSQQQKQEQQALDAAYKNAQIESEKALTQQRRLTTGQKLKELASANSKKQAVNKVKDYNELVKLEISAREKLKDIVKMDLDKNISEEYIDMKALAEELSKKRKELEDGKQEESKVSLEAEAKADEIEDIVNEKLSDTVSSQGKRLANELRANAIMDYAQANGMQISFDKILTALRKYSTADIIERVRMAQNQNKQKQSIPENQWRSETMNAR